MIFAYGDLFLIYRINYLMKAKGVKKEHLTFKDLKSLSRGNDLTI